MMTAEKEIKPLIINTKLPKSPVNDTNQSDSIINENPVVLLNSESPEFNLKFKSVSGFSATNYLHSVHWSPDGLCLLALSEENTVKLYETPKWVYESSLQKKNSSETESPENLKPSGETTQTSLPETDWTPLININEKGSIYGVSWNPRMNSSDPSSCHFLAATRQRPIRCYDAFDGSLRASYTPVDRNDNVVTAFSICYTPKADEFASGHIGHIQLFRLALPGKSSEFYELEKRKGKKSKRLISSVDYSPNGKLLVCGDLGGKISLVDVRLKGACLEMISEKAKNGITQVKYTCDEVYVVAGARKSNAIEMWDTRMGEQPIAWFTRPADGNQKLLFDFDGDGTRLMAGGNDGSISLFDLYSEEDNPSPEQVINTNLGVINSVSFNPCFGLTAVSTGTRSFKKVWETIPKKRLLKLDKRVAVEKNKNNIQKEADESSDSSSENDSTNYEWGIFVYGK